MELKALSDDGGSSIISPGIEMIETDLLCLLFTKLGFLDTLSDVLSIDKGEEALEALSESAGLWSFAFRCEYLDIDGVLLPGAGRPCSEH